MVFGPAPPLQSIWGEGGRGVHREGAKLQNGKCAGETSDSPVVWGMSANLKDCNVSILSVDCTFNYHYCFFCATVFCAAVSTQR